MQGTIATDGMRGDLVGDKVGDAVAVMERIGNGYSFKASGGITGIPGDLTGTAIEYGPGVFDTGGSLVPAGGINIGRTIITDGISRGTEYYCGLNPDNNIKRSTGTMQGTIAADGMRGDLVGDKVGRSEERRVGKECAD